MKKLGKNGMSLVELIVSFTLVLVAILYFFQTLNIVQKIYKKTSKMTNEYVDKTYIYKISNAYIENKGVIGLDEFLKTQTGASSVSVSTTPSDKIVLYEINIDGKIYKLYKSAVVIMLGDSSSFAAYYAGTDVLTPKNNVLKASYAGTEVERILPGTYSNDTIITLSLASDCGGAVTNDTRIELLDPETNNLIKSYSLSIKQATWNTSSLVLSHPGNYKIKVFTKHRGENSACTVFTAIDKVNTGNITQNECNNLSSAYIGNTYNGNDKILGYYFHCFKSGSNTVTLPNKINTLTASYKNTSNSYVFPKTYKGNTTVSIGRAVDCNNLSNITKVYLVNPENEKEEYVSEPYTTTKSLNWDYEEKEFNIDKPYKIKVEVTHGGELEACSAYSSVIINEN